MGLSKKRKQHLAHITARAAETKKHRRIDEENQRRRRFLRKQREEEDFWDEHEDFRSESSSDESDSAESSLDGYSSDEEVLDEGENGMDGTQEGLGDDNGGVPLGVKENVIVPIWKKNAGGHLRGIRGCGSSATEKRERRRKRELEKSASTTRSIVDMFSAQIKKNQPQDVHVSSTSSPAILPPKNTEKKIRETRFESQTRAVHDLSELLHLKTIQIDKYGHVLDPKSNLYRRHQMVQSFLWMQLKKEKDNPNLDRQGLAQIVANSFNRRAYTGRKIIQWERSWVNNRTIPCTKAGKHRHIVSWMEDEDLILSVKEWSRKSGESKLIFNNACQLTSD